MRAPAPAGADRSLPIGNRPDGTSLVSALLPQVPPAGNLRSCPPVLGIADPSAAVSALRLPQFADPQPRLEQPARAAELRSCWPADERGALAAMNAPTMFSAAHGWRRSISARTTTAWFTAAVPSWRYQRPSASVVEQFLPRLYPACRSGRRVAPTNQARGKLPGAEHVGDARVARDVPQVDAGGGAKPVAPP